MPCDPDALVRRTLACFRVQPGEERVTLEIRERSHEQLGTTSRGIVKFLPDRGALLVGFAQSYHVPTGTELVKVEIPPAAS